MYQRKSDIGVNKEMQRGIKPLNGERNDIIVRITARKKNDTIEYSLESREGLTQEQLDYYLGGVIDGLCEWKTKICEEKARKWIKKKYPYHLKQKKI